jgi:hypothetical protein
VTDLTMPRPSWFTYIWIVGLIVYFVAVLLF